MAVKIYKMPDEDSDEETYRRGGDMKDYNEKGKEEDYKDDEGFYEEMLELIRKDFKREVLILSKLNHTNIVKVYFFTHSAIIFLWNVRFYL